MYGERHDTVSSPQSPLLEIDQLLFSYPALEGLGAPTLLNGLDLALSRGELLVVLGAADAGKTSLSRIIAGFVPRFTGGRMEGSLRWEGAEISGTAPYELIERIGMVSQDSDAQIITTRCDTEVAFALESLGVPRGQMQERVDSSLSRFGLEGFRGRNPSTLSGGEKKRLLFACLDALDPELWLLDESLEELDQSWKRRILDHLAKAGKTVLAFDARLPEHAQGHAHRFALLSGGRIAASAHRADETSFRAALDAEGITPRPRTGTRPERTAREALRVQGLSFSFPGPSGFTLDIESVRLNANEICVLAGRNGSGKSTFGRILCGLLPPQAGSLMLVSETSVRQATADDLSSSVGYLFQNPDHQIYLPSVREELALGLQRVGIGKPEIERRVAEAVRLFALPDPSTPPALMSYGARKRLQAATYHLLDRVLLVLDEVDAGLSSREVEDLLDALAGRGAGILLITHDFALARSFADRILAMDQGRIVADLLPRDFDRLDSVFKDADRI